MPSDKSGQLIAQLGSYYQQISVANGYFNNLVTDGVQYGVETFNDMGLKDEDYPRITLISNQTIIPEFSTKSCSRTHIEITVHGYLRKAKNREQDLASYQETLAWAKDMKDAFRAYLNGQDGGDVDADLLDSELQQQIGYSTNTIVVSHSFTLGFDEKLGV